jgi:hypothetical protein
MEHLILRPLAQRTRQAWGCSNIDLMPCFAVEAFELRSEEVSRCL